MFFKNFKTKVALLVLSLFIIPINVFAYSDRLIVGGENIGITLNSKGILIVGIYDVGGNYPAKEAGLKSGDIITSINDAKVKNIEDMADKISNSNDSFVKVGYLRDGKKQSASLKLYKDESNVYKTGLFVKDSITGIGTLTFIDPETKIFGALGHEIQEQSTGELLEIKDGKIFNSNVTGVIPSSDGNPGEKRLSMMLLRLQEMCLKIRQKEYLVIIRHHYHKKILMKLPNLTRLKRVKLRF